MTQIVLSQASLRLANGLAGIPLKVSTANPISFHQLISRPQHMPAAEIDGQLFLPPGDAPATGWPVVIVVPGSLGVAPSHLAKAELLARENIATCVIDPFGARGVQSTVANQAQYSFAASAWDVLAAAAVLRARGDIDPARTGAQGHSRGGSAVLSAACVARVVGIAGLCGVYAAYPWCGQQFEIPDVGDTVVRSIVGDQDEWCLPQQVQGYMHAMRLAGGRATCRIVPGAHHSFDRDTPLELVEDASVAPAAPTIYIRGDGCYVHPASGEADPEFTERELMLYGIKAGYGRRGAHIGSSDDSADVFHADMLNFWRETMSAAR